MPTLGKSTKKYSLTDRAGLFFNVFLRKLIPWPRFAQSGPRSFDNADKIFSPNSVAGVLFLQNGCAFSEPLVRRWPATGPSLFFFRAPFATEQRPCCSTMRAPLRRNKALVVLLLFVDFLQPVDS